MNLNETIKAVNHNLLTESNMTPEELEEAKKTKVKYTRQEKNKQTNYRGYSADEGVEEDTEDYFYVNEMKHDKDDDDDGKEDDDGDKEDADDKDSKKKSKKDVNEMEESSYKCAKCGHKGQMKSMKESSESDASTALRNILRNQK